MRVQCSKKRFPDDFLDQFLCGDAVSVLKEIPDESLDLAVTSPPYNLKIPPAME